MKRRDFLRVGAGGVVGAASLGGGSAAASPAPNFHPEAVEAALERIDRRMASFRNMDFLPRGPRTEQERELFAQRTRLARSALRTFYITGAFTELDEHDRAHPGMQARIRRMQREMDGAVGGMATLLESLTPEQHRILQEELRRDPDLAVRIGEQFNQVAKDDGFGFVRRIDLRLAFDDVSRRMRAQNPSLLIDPYVRKVRRIQANIGSDAERERAVAVRAGEKAFWDFQQRNAAYLQAWDRVYAGRPRGDLARLEEVYPDAGGGDGEADRTGGNTRVLAAGGYVMGFGALSALAGGFFYLLAAASSSSAMSSVFIAPAVVLGVTVGPILLAVGLLIVIVGSIVYLATTP